MKKKSLSSNKVSLEIKLTIKLIDFNENEDDKIGHSSRSSSIQRIKTAEEVSGNVKNF